MVVLLWPRSFLHCRKLKQMLNASTDEDPGLATVDGSTSKPQTNTHDGCGNADLGSSQLTRW